MVERAENENVLDMQTRKSYIEHQRVPLSAAPSQFGGGSGSGGMETTTPLKDYVDARDDAVESRLDQKLGTLATASNVRNNIWGAAAAIVGILLATLAIAGDRFDGGMSVSPIVAASQKGQQEKNAEQDVKLELIDDKLDILIKQTAD